MIPPPRPCTMNNSFSLTFLPRLFSRSKPVQKIPIRVTSFPGGSFLVVAEQGSLLSRAFPSTLSVVEHRRLSSSPLFYSRLSSPRPEDSRFSNAQNLGFPMAVLLLLTNASIGRPPFCFVLCFHSIFFPAFCFPPRHTTQPLPMTRSYFCFTFIHLFFEAMGTSPGLSTPDPSLF